MSLSFLNQSESLSTPTLAPMMDILGAENGALHTFDAPETLFANDWIYLCPEAYLCTLCMVLLMWGVWLQAPVAGGDGHGSVLRPALGYTMGGQSVLAMACTLFLLWTGGSDRTLLGGALTADGISDSLALLTGVATIIALLYSMAYTAEEEDSLAPFEVNALILLVGLAMVLLVRADDLLVIYLCVEFQSLALYVLAAGRSHSILSVEAGMKYFVLGAVASGIFVFGAALLYGTTGLTKLTDLQLFLQGMEAMPLDTGVVLALACVGIGLLFKVGAAPFHWWVGDVYEGAPLPITAFFGIGPKVAIFGLIIRLFTLDGLYLQAAWGVLLPGCIALSFLVGAWGALTQTKIKRLFAYSSIGHTGWVLLGLATGTADGIGAALVYLVLYLAMSALVFALLLTLRTQAEGSRLTHLAQFSGLMRAEPLVAACMAVALLSMAGIPPLAGFASKATILFAALDAQMWWVALVGLLTSVVSTFYYLRLISNMIFTESTEGAHTYDTPSWSLGMGASLLTFGLIGFGLYPQPLLTSALVLGLGG